MGNLIKINIYAEMKKIKNDQLKLQTVEEFILKYNYWIKSTNKEDKIENYQRFLQAL
jgi:D-mannonate dehydratase